MDIMFQSQRFEIGFNSRISACLKIEWNWMKCAIILEKSIIPACTYVPDVPTLWFHLNFVFGCFRASMLKVHTAPSEISWHGNLFVKSVILYKKGFVLKIVMLSKCK